jgi:hypothetical protein
MPSLDEEDAGLDVNDKKVSQIFCVSSQSSFFSLFFVDLKSFGSNGF